MAAFFQPLAYPMLRTWSSHLTRWFLCALYRPDWSWTLFPGFPSGILATWPAQRTLSASFTLFHQYYAMFNKICFIWFVNLAHRSNRLWKKICQKRLPTLTTPTESKRNKLPFHQICRALFILNQSAFQRNSPEKKMGSLRPKPTVQAFR